MNFVRVSFFIPAAILIATLQGCAPGLGKEIPVTRFPAPSEMIQSRGTLGPVLVKPFTDDRSDAAVVRIDGRAISAKSDVPNAVRGSVESYLRAAGYMSGAIDAPIVSGSVLAWSAHVSPGFPSSRAEATASLSLAVLKPDGTEHFRATYQGESSVAHPLLNEDRIADALGQAMATAILAAIQDPRFTAALSGSAGSY